MQQKRKKKRRKNPKKEIEIKLALKNEINTLKQVIEVTIRDENSLDNNLKQQTKERDSTVDCPCRRLRWRGRPPSTASAPQTTCR